MSQRTILHGLLKIPYIGNASEELFFRLAGWLFPRNKPTLFVRSIGRELIEKYDGHQGQGARGDTGHPGLGLVHYSLVTTVKPKKILCIGSKKGYIPAMLALACKENSFGHVDFVDAGYGLERVNHWGGIAWWKRVDPKKHFSSSGLGKYLTSYVMKSSEFTKKYPRRMYDYIYLDGDHSYEGVKRDYLLSWPRLRSGGLMLFHDIVPKRMPSQPPYGVWKFWRELQGGKISLSGVGTGLGILQK
jgi:hypothetical protein